MKKSVIALCFLFFIIVILLFLIFQNQAILPIDRDDSFYFSDCGYMYYNNGFLFPYNDNKYDGKEITNLKNSYIDGQINYISPIRNFTFAMKIIKTKNFWGVQKSSIFPIQVIF